MNTGYREMLRDRSLKMDNLALKYFKCKEKWLTHMYKSWVWIYPDKESRYKAAKELLKLDKHGKAHYMFEDTILWDDLSLEEGKFWKKVSSCVSWFRKQYQYVENDYTDSIDTIEDIRRIKYDIMIKYICKEDIINEFDFLSDMCPTQEDDDEVKKQKNIIINDFVDYIMNCLKNRI